MSDLELLRPLWLLLLPLLALLVLVLRRRPARLGGWDMALDPHLKAALQALGRVDAGRRGFAALAPLLAAGLIFAALSGPAVERRDAAAYRNLDGVVFVMDASESLEEDGNRLALQTAGRVGVAALQSRPAALVVYAGDAYVATDMTADTRQLGQTLSLVDGETVPDKGSRPERGLSLAATILAESGTLAGDVILMTDGAGIGSDAMQAAAEIAGQGARLSVVVPGDVAAAETLARTGGGEVFRTPETQALASFLQEDARDRLERQDYPLLFRMDLGRYLLLLALIPVLLMFRRAAA